MTLILLRRYFWAFYLLVIALCAFFAAHGIGRLVMASLPRPVPQVRSASQPSYQAIVAGNQRDVTAILERNIFCSSCEPVAIDPSATAEDNEPVSDGLTKTSLNLKLLATLVSDKNSAWSFAAIMDPASEKTFLHPIGSTIGGSAVITDITARRVLLLNGRRNEYLDLDQMPDEGEASTPTVTRTSRPQQKDELAAEFESGIQRVGGSKWEIQRSALNKVLGNTTMLARSARIVPSVKDGQPNGFKLYAIRPGSIYSMLGMFNGDTINAINGHPMTTPDKALEIYTKLRSASHVTISFTRQGKTLTHEYTIR